MAGWFSMRARIGTLPTSVRRPASASPAIRGAGQHLQRLPNAGLAGELAQLRLEVAFERLA